MSNITTAYSNTVIFRLTATNVDSLVLLTEPIGWRDDDLELDRHKDYHGIFINFTNNLEFINEAKSYIERAYDIGGINANLILTKEILIDNGTDLIFKTRYTAIADFSTMVKSQTRVVIKFNSNNLAELIKSHESDDFEIESSDVNKPSTSIDGKILDELVLDTTEIKGRSIQSLSELQLKGKRSYFGVYDSSSRKTPTVDLISETQTRVSAVTKSSYYVAPNSSPQLSSLNMFYDLTNIADVSRDITIQYDLNFNIIQQFTDSFGNTVFEKLDIDFVRCTYNDGTAKWSEVEVVNIFSQDTFDNENEKILSNKITFTVSKDDGLLIRYIGNNFIVNKESLILSEVAHFDSSPNLEFIFSHDLSKRLLYIITGRNNAYYSKYFGRKTINIDNEIGFVTGFKDPYIQDGEGGLIGVMSGLWARAFDRNSEKYKSLTISLKDLIESNRAVFNTGIGIETFGLEERLREEDLRYFYQNEVVVRLPNQIKNVKRIVDNDLFFSGMTFGYEKSGDYEDSMGLDEPNTRTDYVTPIRKSTKKFIKTSKIRSDEYGMELARRKPQLTYPNEDTRYDEGNWYLDLKRTIGLGYEQKDYTDRLQELPSGIHSPETYRSMYFTPLRMLFRHAWVFRSGLEKYLDKYIKYISAVSNSQLVTLAIGETLPYAENADVLVRNLDRSRFLPEIVEFEHPVNDELMEWISGTTELEYLGEKENIPNVYFKFEYLNENGILERGYLLNLKPNKEGKWQMQLSNENIIV